MAIQASNALFRTGQSNNFLANAAVVGGGVSAATPNNLHNDQAGSPENTFVQTQSKNDVRKASIMLFDMDGGSNGGGLTIPAGSIITDAYLRLQANGAWTGAFTNLSTAVVARDGFWDAIAPTWGKVGVNGTADCVVRTTAPAVVADTNPTALNGTWEAWNGNLDSVQTPGQTITTVGSGNLGEVDFHLSRTVTHSSNMVVRVYAVGGDGRPTGGVLATSDNVAYNTLATGAGGIVTFPFSGGNQIALSNSTRYAFIVVSLGSVRFRVHIQTSGIYGAVGTGEIVAGGLTLQFSDANYPQMGSLPLLYEADDSTIRTAPHGGISNTSFPDFASDNVFYEVRPTRLKDRVQEWIDDGSYVEGGGVTGSWMPIQIAPTSSTEVGITRQWDLAELRVSWRPRQTFVG